MTVLHSGRQKTDQEFSSLKGKKLSAIHTNPTAETSKHVTNVYGRAQSFTT